jgi:hypothetical protein
MKDKRKIHLSVRLIRTFLLISKSFDKRLPLKNAIGIKKADSVPKIYTLL